MRGRRYKDGGEMGKGEGKGERNGGNKEGGGKE